VSLAEAHAETRFNDTYRGAERLEKRRRKTNEASSGEKILNRTKNSQEIERGGKNKGEVLGNEVEA